MTTRQPESAPPGAAGPGRDPAAAQLWLLRLLPLALLIIGGLAGLRGAVGTPRWNGPLHRDAPVIGAIVVAVLIAAAVVTGLRMRRGGQDPVARKLRAVLLFAELAGIATVTGVAIAGLHLHLFSRNGAPARRLLAPTPTAQPSRRAGGSAHPSTIHVSAAALLYVLLVVVLVAAIAICVWYARRLRAPIQPSEDDFIVEDAKDLREAVKEGRSALMTADDARAAIIACYVAMENRLADRGAARALADTPDELLARAQQTGVVRGRAAGRLTALFYEARFSSHPLAAGQREAAAAALDELAAALAQDQPAPDGASS